MITIKCQNHPKYKAMTAPMASCVPCQVLYNIKQSALDNKLQVR